MSEPLSHEEFSERISEIAKLLTASDGVHVFLGGEIKTLFAKDREFRNLVRENLPPETESELPELVRAQNFLLENREEVWKILRKAKHQLSKEKVTHLRSEEEPILLKHSKKIFETLEVRRDYLRKADKHIESLLERGSGKTFKSEKKKREKIEQVKKSIMVHRREKSVKDVSERYLRNSFPKPYKPQEIMDGLSSNLSFELSPTKLENIRREHFPRVKKLKLSSAHEKTRKARR